MLKIVITLAILVGLYFLLFKRPAMLQRKPRKPKGRGSDANEDVMVECPECGTYVSSKEAIIKNGVMYCSKECAKVR